jgi:hypothetical protein
MRYKPHAPSSQWLGLPWTGCTQERLNVAVFEWEALRPLQTAWSWLSVHHVVSYAWFMVYRTQARKRWDNKTWFVALLRDWLAGPHLSGLLLPWTHEVSKNGEQWPMKLIKLKPECYSSLLMVIALSPLHELSTVSSLLSQAKMKPRLSYEYESRPELGTKLSSETWL